MANFKSTSRYNKPIATNNRVEQPFIILRTPLVLTESPDDTYITVTQEYIQRPDLIAQTAYGNPDLWWILYDINGITDPLFGLKIGQILRIPTYARIQEILDANEA